MIAIVSSLRTLDLSVLSRRESGGNPTDAPYPLCDFSRCSRTIIEVPPNANGWDTPLVGSSGQRPRKKRKQQPRPSESGGRSPMVPTYSPLTPEGQIEGIGRFADGLKRIITNWQRRR